MDRHTRHSGMTSSKGLKILIALLVVATLYIISFFLGTFDISSSNQIAIIPIVGTISSDGFTMPLGSKNVNSLDIVDLIERAEKEEAVKAIVLSINSGGGTVVASREIENAVKKAKKPVIAWIREVGASGAYWIASAADWIIADRLSMTGSIGVTGSSFGLVELMEKYGIEYRPLYKGEYKETGSMFKPLTTAEQKKIEEKLDLIYKAFVQGVAVNRNMTLEDAYDAANGLTFLGEEAVELNLVDQLGGKEEALETARSLAGIEEAEPIEYTIEESVIDIIKRLGLQQAKISIDPQIIPGVPLAWYDGASFR